MILLTRFIEILVIYFNIFVEFFKKNKVGVMSIKALFDFITDPTITEENMDKYLDVKSKQMSQQNDQDDPKQQIEEQVFKQAYIPQNLSQVILW